MRPWYEHYPGKQDVEWLPFVGASGWVILSKDKDLRKNYLEIKAILNSGARAFVLTAGEIRKEEQAEVFLRAMPRIKRICRRKGPFIFNITQMGNMSEVSSTKLRRRS